MPASKVRNAWRRLPGGAANHNVLDYGLRILAPLLPEPAVPEPAAKPSSFRDGFLDVASVVVLFRNTPETTEHVRTRMGSEQANRSTSNRDPCTREDIWAQGVRTRQETTEKQVKHGSTSSQQRGQLMFKAPAPAEPTPAASLALVPVFAAKPTPAPAPVPAEPTPPTPWHGELVDSCSGDSRFDEPRAAPLRVARGGTQRRCRASAGPSRLTLQASRASPQLATRAGSSIADSTERAGIPCP